MTKTKQNRPIYNYLIEQTTMVSPSQIEILTETKTRDGYSKIIFKSRLQEHSVTNKNGRVYPKLVCENIVSRLAPRAKSRNMFMEVDHPIFFEGSNDPEQLKKRAGIVELKNCGAVCRNISMKDNCIIGEIETLSGFKGPDIANVILNDKIDIGFSLRALGGVNKLDNGILEVQSNIMPITYDFVTNPSHENSRIMEFLPENDFSLLDGCNTLIYEGQELELLKDDEIDLCEGNNVKNFLDDVIRENFRHVVSKKIKFLI